MYACENVLGRVLLVHPLSETVYHNEHSQTVVYLFVNTSVNLGSLCLENFLYIIRKCGARSQPNYHFSSSVGYPFYQQVDRIPQILFAVHRRKFFCDTLINQPLMT